MCSSWLPQPSFVVLLPVFSLKTLKGGFYKLIFWLHKLSIDGDKKSSKLDFLALVPQNSY
jgi:hypothetical protein